MYVFIMNPLSGNGKAKKIFKELQSLSFMTKQNVKLFSTKNNDQLSEIANEIKRTIQNGESIRLIIIIGGDGTIHQLVNFLHPIDIPIAYIPGGTGNDFARGIQLKGTPVQVLTDAIEKQEINEYWLGRYKTEEAGERYFVNCLGLGFDAVVAKRANESKIRKLLNLLRLHSFIYVIALIQELITYKPIHLTLNIDGVKQRYENVLFITVNNHPYFGGGMKINPQANNNSGELSLILVEMLPKWKILTFFSTVFFGKHTFFKEVHLLKGKHIIIETDEKFPYQVDGEIAYTKTVSVSIDDKPLLLK